MSEHKPKPIDDLKEGFGLLFRAAKGAVEKLPTAKVEAVAMDAVKEVSRAFESLGTEIDRALGKEPRAPEARHDDVPPEPPRANDAHAPEPPRDEASGADRAARGPRIG